MTVKKLITLLQAIDKKRPRLQVCVHAEEMIRGCNDTFQIIPVRDVEIRLVEMADDDGFHTDKSRMTLVLS